MAKSRTLNVTGSVEHNIYVCEFRYEYIPKTFLDPKHEEIIFTACYIVGEESGPIKERDIPKDDLEWLEQKAINIGRDQFKHSL